MAIQLVLVADVRLYREGLASILEGRGQLRVLGTASDRKQARSVVKELQPDIVIIDVSMGEALELMEDLHVEMPAVRQMALGVSDDIAAIVECAVAGASGYVSMAASIEDAVGAIERLAAGELVCSPRVAAELFRRVGSRPERDPSLLAGDLLTSREMQVLSLLRQKLSNKEIALALNIAEATVKNHVHHLLDKLQVRRREQAAAWLPARRTPLRSRALAEPVSAGPSVRS